MAKFIRTTMLMTVAGGLASGALALGAGVAQADPWNPCVPGLPCLNGPGVNIGIPGNPLPPGQLKKLDDWIPDLGNLIPKGKGKWK